MKETDTKRMGQDYQSEDRAKETGERKKKNNRMDEKREEKRRGEGNRRNTKLRAREKT